MFAIEEKCVRLGLGVSRVVESIRECAEAADRAGANSFVYNFGSGMLVRFTDEDFL
jgi:hypothetical protein